MAKKPIVSLSVLFVTVTVLTNAFPRDTVVLAQDDSQRSERRDMDQSAGFVRGRVLVQFRARTLSTSGPDLLAEAGARDTGVLPASDVHVLELPEGADEQAAVRALQSLPEVEFAELDGVIPPADVTPNDPWYTNWEWHLGRILAPTAWSGTVGGANIVVAILDTGVDDTHEDLVSKIVPGWNVYDNTPDTRDINGHGTLVAGTAAASSNNGVGVASVAWGCRIMPVRISDSAGYGYFSTMASGLTWAADHGARVANLSYRASTSSTVASAAQYFQSRGGVVTVAAGNEGAFESSPDNPYVLTVTGTDSNDSLYAWSNTGNNLDVTAPGSAYTTVRGGGYSAASGTSIAAPIVAGVAALVLSANPVLTGDEVQTILRQSSDDIGSGGWDSSYGWGRVNAAHAVALASGGSVDNTPPAVDITSPSSGGSVAGTISVQIAATDNVGVTSVTLDVDGVSLGTDTVAPWNFTWNTTTATNGTHTVTATGRDAAGNTASNAVSVTVANSPDTSPPMISILSPTNGARVSSSVSVSVSASDQVGVVRVELYVDGARVATSTASPFTNKWNAKKARAGAHTLQCKAYDAAGNVGLSQPCSVTK